MGAYDPTRQVQQAFDYLAPRFKVPAWRAEEVTTDIDMDALSCGEAVGRYLHISANVALERALLRTARPRSREESLDHILLMNWCACIGRCAGISYAKHCRQPVEPATEAYPDHYRVLHGTYGTVCSDARWFTLTHMPGYAIADLLAETTLLRRHLAEVARWPPGCIKEGLSASSAWRPHWDALLHHHGDIALGLARQKA